MANAPKKKFATKKTEPVLENDPKKLEEKYTQLQNIAGSKGYQIEVLKAELKNIHQEMFNISSHYTEIKKTLKDEPKEQVTQ